MVLREGSWMVSGRVGRRSLHVLAWLLLFAAPASVAAKFRLPPSDARSVHDLAGVISPEDARVMEARHRELFDKTGVAIVVITVPDLEGESIEDFAVRVGTEWGVGVLD